MGKVNLIIIILSILGVYGCSEIIPVSDSNSASFQKLYGLEYEDEEVVSIIELVGGGYAAVGINEAVGDSTSDIALLHINEQGNLIANYTYGGFNYEDAHSIIQTSDGGFIVTGRTMSFTHSGSDILLIKLTPDFSVQWSKIYAGTGTERALCIKQLSDGGYVISGATDSFGAGGSDMLIMRLTTNGIIMWSKTFVNMGFDIAHSISITTGDEIITAGWLTSSNNTQDICIIKLDIFGNTIWQKLYGESGSELAFSIEYASANSFVVTGWTDSYSAGGSDVFLLNVDNSGNVNWFKTYQSSLREEGRNVKRTNNGGFVISGFTFSSGAGDGDAILLKTNASGMLENARTFGEGLFDVVYNVCISSDGGYIMPGSTILASNGKTDARIVKSNFEGISCGSRDFPGLLENSNTISGNQLQLTPNTSKLIERDVYIVKSTFPALEMNLCP